MQLVAVAGDSDRFLFVDVYRSVLSTKWMSGPMTEEQVREVLEERYSPEQIDGIISWARRHPA